MAKGALVRLLFCFCCVFGRSTEQVGVAVVNNTDDVEGVDAAVCCGRSKTIGGGWVPVVRIFGRVPSSLLRSGCTELSFEGSPIGGLSEEELVAGVSVSGRGCGGATEVYGGGRLSSET